MSSVEDLFSEEIRSAPIPERGSKRPKRSNGSNASNATPMTMADVKEVRNTSSKMKYTLAERYSARRCGLTCTICLKKDTDPDKVRPAEKMLWAMVAVDKKETEGKGVVMLVTQGATCYWDFRVWNARFLTQFPKLGDYKQHLALDCGTIRNVFVAVCKYKYDTVVNHLVVCISGTTEYKCSNVDNCA